MRMKGRIFQHGNTQGYSQRDHINLHHPLAELADMIDWAAIDRVDSEPFQPGTGRPILRPRLVAGLLYLQHVKGPLDDAMHAVLCGAGHNIRLIINKLKSCGPMAPAYYKVELFSTDPISTFRRLCFNLQHFINAITIGERGEPKL